MNRHPAETAAAEARQAPAQAGGAVPERPPGSRDHGIDALRAVAICAVVLGHWLVTALVPAADGALTVHSPLEKLDWVAPVTWLLQTLGLFFFVAGYAAGRSRPANRRQPADPTQPADPPQPANPTQPANPHRRADPPGAAGTGSALTSGWLIRRLRRLGAPVARFVAIWALALAIAALAGAPADSLETAARLAVSPLWFLVVLAALGTVTGPVRRLVARRHGTWLLVGAGVLVVAASDAGIGCTPVTVLAGWLVPYALGVALAAGRLRNRGSGWALLFGGGLALAALVLVAGYPASAVGVPGAGRSNLNPPSLLAVSLALAQTGAALLVRERLGSVRRVVVARINAAAMQIYLWHQTALIAVTVLALRLAGEPVPGLHSGPETPTWVAARLGWLPVFGMTLWLVLRASRSGSGLRRSGNRWYRGSRSGRR